MTRSSPMIAALAVIIQSAVISKPVWGQEEPTATDPNRIPRVAGITTEYRHNSHADVILTRLLKTDTLDGRGRATRLKLASVYTDQVPANDTSRTLAAQHGFRISSSVRDALTLGADRLAVDGVLLVAEHGNYPESDTGQFQFPKRRLFAEIAAVIEQSGRPIPVFHDKHLADNWEDAKWIYDRARELKIPLMAGSSLPVLWRSPPTDVRRGAELKHILAVSYHRLDSYGFHVLEAVQALAERRAGNESGIAAVQCLTGEAVWNADSSGVYDRKLLDAAELVGKKPHRFCFVLGFLTSLAHGCGLASWRCCDLLRIRVNQAMQSISGQRPPSGAVLGIFSHFSSTVA